MGDPDVARAYAASCGIGVWLGRMCAVWVAHGRGRVRGYAYVLPSHVYMVAIGRAQ